MCRGIRRPRHQCVRTISASLWILLHRWLTSMTLWSSANTVSSGRWCPFTTAYRPPLTRWRPVADGLNLTPCQIYPKSPDLFSSLVHLCCREDGLAQPMTARKPRFTPRSNTCPASAVSFSFVRDPKNMKPARRKAYNVSVLDSKPVSLRLAPTSCSKSG